MTVADFDEKDAVLVGWHGTPHCESTQVNCELCGRKVWISTASVNNVLDSALREKSKAHVICMFCAPKDVAIQVSDEQKLEMKQHGLDIDAVSEATGKSISEMAHEVWADVHEAEANLNAMRTLHRAANPDGCGNERCEICKIGLL